MRQRGLAWDGTHLAVLSLSGDDTFTHQPVKNTRVSFPLGPKFPNVLPRRHFVCVHLGLSTHCAVLYNNDTILFNNDDDDIAALHIFGLCYYCLECWSVFTTLEVELLRLTWNLVTERCPSQWHFLSAAHVLPAAGQHGEMGSRREIGTWPDDRPSSGIERKIKVNKLQGSGRELNWWSVLRSAQFRGIAPNGHVGLLPGPYTSNHQGKVESGIIKHTYVHYYTPISPPPKKKTWESFSRNVWRAQGTTPWRI